MDPILATAQRNSPSPAPQLRCSTARFVHLQFPPPERMLTEPLVIDHQITNEKGVATLARLPEHSTLHVTVWLPFLLL
jgi:hypothetical protein